jgi:prepilin-type N-terminal cleavage/methylation domain-containing protein
MSGQERGLTVVEILIAMTIFSIVAVGAIGVIGANSSGFLEAVPTGLGTARNAKDTTAAIAYLQALHEHAATVGGGAINPATHSGTFTPVSGSGPLGFALPSEAPFQLDWTTLAVVFETRVWSGSQYVPGTCNPGSDTDCVVLVRSTLTWQFKGTTRPPLTAERILAP